MRENRDQNNSEYGQFLSSVSLYEIHVYFWGNLLPMKFLTLAHYIIICHRDVRSEVKRKKKYIYIYIHIFFFRENMGGGTGGWWSTNIFLQHELVFVKIKYFLLTWNTFLCKINLFFLYQIAFCVTWNCFFATKYFSCNTKFLFLYPEVDLGLLQHPRWSALW